MDSAFTDGKKAFMSWCSSREHFGDLGALSSAAFGFYAIPGHRCH